MRIRAKQLTLHLLFTLSSSSQRAGMLSTMNLSVLNTRTHSLVEPDALHCGVAASHAPMLA